MPEVQDQVAVRMYRGILGDCFLVTVAEKGERRHILIDCGVLQSVISGDDMMLKLPQEVTRAIGEERLRKVQAGGAQIRRVAQDVSDYIKANGGRIDLLVLTHEHYDHLSGFALAWNVWSDAELKIDKLWLAWTEDPADAQAKALYARFAKGKQALAYAAQLADNDAFAMDDSLRDAAALAAFIGPVDAPGLPAAAVDPDNPKAPRTMNDVIQRMKAKVGPEGTRYLEPGQVIDRSEGAGLKAYVLAPPRAQERLDRDLPGSKEKNTIYLTGHDEAAAVASAARAQLRMAGMLGADSGGAALPAAELSQDSVPFARPHRRPYPAEDYSSESEDRAKLRLAYEDKAEEVRRIDGDWTAAAGALALKMDSDTNNTSLVLAFELPDGRVLLFPGDAQVGNWESWGDQTYPSAKFRKEGDSPSQTIDEILRRVVFYKVGHHASHNATLRTRGLELMTDPRLSAAIPVVEAVAAVQGPGKKVPGKGWKMPYGHLHKELQHRTEGRIVQGDGDPEAERQAFAARDAGVSIAHEDPATGGLWVELSFPLNPAPGGAAAGVRRGQPA
ncbi:MAG TPA: MBL fold metallo-hydrolase [Allosphingosinicella sp.]|nr:MBL fold metallo-hydrolase [Allosphingosinicella sp.]